MSEQQAENFIVFLWLETPVRVYYILVVVRSFTVVKTTRCKRSRTVSALARARRAAAEEQSSRAAEQAAESQCRRTRQDNTNRGLDMFKTERIEAETVYFAANNNSMQK